MGMTYFLLNLPCRSLSSGAFHLRKTAEEFNSRASIPYGASEGTGKETNFGWVRFEFWVRLRLRSKVKWLFDCGAWCHPADVRSNEIWWP